MQKTDTVIVLRRVNYGEKDRIVTYLGREHGKFAVLARSVRGPKSKLAGGCEPLSLVELSFIEGKSTLSTLSGARLVRHYHNIVRDMDRMNRSFDAIKIVDRLARDGEGQEHYGILRTYLDATNDEARNPVLSDIWLHLALLEQAGSVGDVKPLLSQSDQPYGFDHDKQIFVQREGGNYTKDDIKIFLLSKKSTKPIILADDVDLTRVEALVRLLLKTNLLEV
jgi:recombinational DNA repair protein (RecF pathway)